MSDLNILNKEIDLFCTSIEAAKVSTQPYRHLLLTNTFSTQFLDALETLDFPTTDTGGQSGKREYHNDQRHYFSVENRAKEPAIERLAQVFASQTVLQHLHKSTGAVLDGTYVRIEYAQDEDGFWLEPHTDLGVKTITIIISLCDGQEHIGTDIFASQDSFSHSCPFAKGAGLIFVPSDNTWHGFRQRPIGVTRKSIIMNYVTADWRARDQLSFDTPISFKA